MAAHQIVPFRDRCMAALAADLFEPAPTDLHMADLVAIDDAQHIGACVVTRPGKALDHRQGNVEPPGFHHHRHHREAGKQIVRGRLRRLPQPVMGREVAVDGAVFGEPPRKQTMMPGFFIMGSANRPSASGCPWRVTDRLPSG